ncbi:MAG: PhoH family protein [Desulfobulbaceae bacterium]|jgi:phosphate starvation-inducible PhoH-like protein|nr:PhoH family protein [Desulfobulbaceae bacterium]
MKRSANKAANNPPSFHDELNFPDYAAAALLYGEQNRHLHIIEEGAGVGIEANGCSLEISGGRDAVATAKSTLIQLYAMAAKGHPLYSADIAFALHVLQGNPTAKLEKIFLDKVYVTTKNRLITPKTQNQKRYIDAIRDHDIVFGIGPAGTGKTYLAVAMAVAALTNNMVRSIVLTRPAVEAGEKLGFLPGDLAQKVNPYLRPLHDALGDMLGVEKAVALQEQGLIEIAPLAFMRGRTLSSAFIILDEAQNTSKEQMKMFLTRIGFDSRAIITGDSTQIDLPNKQQSGLLDAQELLSGLEGIAFCRFGKEDVVRHPLVQKIIQAYEQSA